MALSFYRHKFELLTKWGFLAWEAREFARQYTTKQIRTLPYMRRMTSWRRLYVSNLQRQGLKPRQISQRIRALYTQRGWIEAGRYDPWSLLRYFRKAAIESGDYVPVKRPGSHHKIKGVSKGDVQAQKKRTRQRRFEAELEDNERKIRNAIAKGDNALRRVLEVERDRIRRRYGQ